MERLGRTQTQPACQTQTDVKLERLGRTQTDVEMARLSRAQTHPACQTQTDVKMERLRRTQPHPACPEMKKHVKVTKTITLAVDSFEEIDGVKDKYYEIECMGTNLEDVLYTGGNFENGQELEYAKKDGSGISMSLHLGVQMQIYVKAAWSLKLIPLDVHSWDTIGDVKIKFQKIEGTPANQLTLIYNKKQLDDDDLQTLAGYDIENNSTIYAVLIGEDKIKISVCPPSERISPTQVMVKLCSTVENLKRIIHYMEKFPVDRQVLTFNGTVLENGQRLTDYNIQMGSELQLNFTRCTYGSMQVFVNTLTGSTLPIFVDSDTLVDTLKTEIRYREGIPEENQRLICSGNQLKDGRTLGDYNIQKDSTIHLCLRLCGC